MEEKQFEELVESLKQGHDMLKGKIVMVPKETINQAIKQFADEVIGEIEANQVLDITGLRARGIIQQALTKRGI